MLERRQLRAGGAFEASAVLLLVTSLVPGVFGSASQSSSALCCYLVLRLGRIFLRRYSLYCRSSHRTYCPDASPAKMFGKFSRAGLSCGTTCYKDGQSANSSAETHAERLVAVSSRRLAIAWRPRCRQMG